jgi:hypothetical protein
MTELANFNSDVLFPMMDGERLRAFRLKGGDYLTRDRHGRARADSDDTAPFGRQGWLISALITCIPAGHFLTRTGCRLSTKYYPQVVYVWLPALIRFR